MDGSGTNLGNLAPSRALSQFIPTLRGGVVCQEVVVPLRDSGLSVTALGMWVMVGVRMWVMVGVEDVGDGGDKDVGDGGR